ncbi:MAG: hypothetical protein FWD56_08295 [Bacteroidales bacterium]|nr:hypothetical protein [Bacteroidales bacterium]
MKTLIKITMTICLAMLAMSVDCTGLEEDPDDPDDPNIPEEPIVEPGNFTQKTLETYPDLRDFIPPGIYHVDGGIYGNYILGRGNDGSFVFTLQGAEHPVEVFFDDRFFYLQWFNLEHTWYKTEVHHQPEEMLYKGDFLLMTGYISANMLSFISGDLCEKKPTSIKDDKVAGINVKQYVYETKSSGISFFQEFWILENGLCLKRKEYSVIAGITIPQPLSDFTVTLTDINPGDFKSILSKFPPIYVGGNQPEKLPAYDNIHRMHFMDYNDKWRTDLYPRELDKWILPYKGSGTIESTTINRFPKEAIERDDLVFKKFDFNGMDVWIKGVSHQDILNYINNEVMKIEYMKGITIIDEMEEYGMYGWEGDNEGRVNITKPGEVDFYIEYKIACWGNATYQISIGVCSVLAV